MRSLAELPTFEDFWTMNCWTRNWSPHAANLVVVVVVVRGRRFLKKP